MQTVTDINLLNQMKSNGALFILFGGEHCAVCQSLHPQLDSILKAPLINYHKFWRCPKARIKALF